MTADALNARRRPPHSLRASLTLYVVLPLIAVLAALGALALQSVEQRGTQRLQSDIQLIARSIRLPVEDALVHGNRQGVQQALDSAFVINRVYGAYVYDRKGDEIAAAGMARRGVKVSRAAAIAHQGSRRGDYGRSGAHRVYSYFIPLTGAGGRIIGLLQVTRRASDFSAFIRRVRTLGLLGLTALAALLAAIIVYGHRRAIGRHLDRLLAGLARIEHGEHAHRLATGGPREIDALSRGINAMLDSIARSERELAHRREHQQALEERLRESEKMAAIGRLAAGLAHELGSPLSVADGHAQRLLRNPSVSAKARASVEDIRTALQRMVLIIRRLMEFGRGGRGQRRPVPLDELARGTRDALLPEARAAHTRIEIRGATPAPVVEMDAVRMEQAVANLLRNAIQAARGGLTRLSWYEGASGELHLTVEDDGPGIAAEQRAHIFEPFYTTKPLEQGTGLGLALALGAVKEHGGTLELAAAGLGGAAFDITLPASLRRAAAGAGRGAL